MVKEANSYNNNNKKKKKKKSSTIVNNKIFEMSIHIKAENCSGKIENGGAENYAHLVSSRFLYRRNDIDLMFALCGVKKALPQMSFMSTSCILHVRRCIDILIFK